MAEAGRYSHRAFHCIGAGGKCTAKADIYGGLGGGSCPLPEIKETYDRTVKVNNYKLQRDGSVAVEKWMYEIAYKTNGIEYYGLDQVKQARKLRAGSSRVQAKHSREMSALNAKINSARAYTTHKNKDYYDTIAGGEGIAEARKQAKRNGDCGRVISC